MQFADIKNDIAFRKIFGNENKKEILISFLNAVLDLTGNKQITWVEILTPYQLPIVLGAKSTILDVKAKDKAGNEYIIEMQVTDRIGFDKRAIYYSAKSYALQLNEKEEYYKLKPVIFIGILNFEFLEGQDYLSKHLILDTKTQEHKLKDLEFNFIELPKFNKNEQELQTLIDKWVYFIKNADILTVIPTNLDDEGLQAAYKEADRHTWNKKDLEAYSYARMREVDEITREMFVEERAAKRATEKAKVHERTEMALKAINKGFDNETIADLTTLSIEEIEKLRNQNKK